MASDYSEIQLATIKAKAYKKIYHFVTVRDATTAGDAFLLALDAIDTGFFARDTVQKFWRRQGQRHASNVGNCSVQVDKPAKEFLL